MENKITICLKDFGPIKEAKIDIGKITVVGGQNASGKSTLSKILYSFFKSNSYNRQDMALDSLSSYIGLLNRVNIRALIDINFENPDRDSDESNFYKEIHEIVVRYGIDDFRSLFKTHEAVKKIYPNNNFSYAFKDEFDKEFEKADKLIKFVNENNEEYYNSLMRKFLKSEFLTKDFEGSTGLYGRYNDDDFEFLIDFSNHNLNSDDSFKSKGQFSIYDVFYFDSISCIDFESPSYPVENHVYLLRRIFYEDMNSSVHLNEKSDDKIIKIESMINEIIDGEFIFIEEDNYTFKTKVYYRSNDGNSCLMGNTASGIKQIGMIQLLLAHRKLKENSCLIFDEPEVNLHPEWQVKLAQILALISSSLDVLVYINSHSPIFIEAIEAFSEFYGLSDETNYYLTELQYKGKYNFNKIEHDDLYLIYDNLGKPYNHIDEIRIKPITD